MDNKPRSYFTFIRCLICGVACLILVPLVTYKELGYLSIVAGVVISLVAFVVAFISYKNYKSTIDDDKKK